MAIEYNTKIYPVSWLMDQKSSGSLNTDISIQRQFVWNNLNMSNLIMAMLKGVVIGNFLFEKDKQKFKVLDGKQRILTLNSYINDNFRLSNKMRYNIHEDHNFSATKFSELPKRYQDTLLNYQLSIQIYNPLTDEERDVIFFMCNQSAPLSKVDLMPVILGDTFMQKLKPLIEHPFAAEKIKWTKAGLRTRADLKIFIQYFISCSDSEMGYSGTDMIKFGDSIKSGDILCDTDKLLSIMDYLNAAFDSRRNYFSQLHIPGIFYAAERAKNKNMPVDEFQQRLDEFFAHTLKNKNTEYNIACTGAKTQRQNVQTRIRIMTEVVEAEDMQMKISDF